MNGALISRAKPVNGEVVYLGQKDLKFIFPRRGSMP